MAKQHRSFSVEQKLEIIQEAEQNGITQTVRKHNLAHSVFLRWKNQFDKGGTKLLQPPYHKIDPELRALQEENARLKKIIGNQYQHFPTLVIKCFCDTINTKPGSTYHVLFICIPN